MQLLKALLLPLQLYTTIYCIHTKINAKQVFTNVFSFDSHSCKPNNIFFSKKSNHISKLLVTYLSAKRHTAQQPT